MNLKEAESWAGLGCTRPYGYVSDRGMRGDRKERWRKGRKDEGVGHSMGEVEESLVGRMKKNKRKVTTENTATQVTEKKNESKHGSHLEKRGGGGAQRCTARSKLPGINLEEAGRRREGRVVAGVDKALGHLAEELDKKKNEEKETRNKKEKE